MKDEKDDLENRVNQYNTLSLPGQPMGCHMGTSYLINDLWKEVKRLRAASQPAVQADPRRCPICDYEYNYCPYCEKSGAA